ncbi:CoA ester lyase [Paracoccus suum]|uniref:CoA ester lyase n=1 Tax=Paracoccus suum TaxID=2259340 RepID=A0A344PKG6_9RHOB|nr:CoA ester lyase [Paracoccus suum]AXC49871.1 CoA ester lyase [Paracoccus suum]
MTPILCRSALYVPASNPRALDKACGLPADAIILDLEDAVAPSQKVAARANLRDVLAADFGGRPRIVRINALAGPWGADDLAAATGADAVLVPKVGGAADSAAVAERAAGVPLWAMIETAAGVLNAGAIAAHPAVAALVMGTNDLAADLRLPAEAGRAPLATALSMSVLAARAHGRLILDGVFPDLRDPAGLEDECAAGRQLGFDGKTVIHPNQIAAANAAFAPTEAEIELARRQIDAFDSAAAEGRGVAVLGGRIVENLHAAMARRTLAQAEAIAARRQPAQITAQEQPPA